MIHEYSAFGRRCPAGRSVLEFRAWDSCCACSSTAWRFSRPRGWCRACYLAGAVPAVIAGLILGLVNALVRPILILLTLPFTLITLGLFLFIVNTICLALTAALVPGFEISGFVRGVPRRVDRDDRELDPERADEGQRAPPVVAYIKTAGC